MADTIFISSVQGEFSSERRAVTDFIRGNPLLSRYFDVFLFEELPASDRIPGDVYLDWIDRSAIYVGLFGEKYGSVDEQGVSPTEREFDRATARGKSRLIFLRGDPEARHPKMKGLVQKAEGQLVRRRFQEVADLNAQLFASLVDYLEGEGSLTRRPFHSSACPGASLDDISEEKLAWFVTKAQQERQFALRLMVSTQEILTHLNLLDEGRPSRAAVLLFGNDPHRFLPGSELKCVHLHGTEVEKPFLSYQRFTGTLFDLVNEGVSFILTRLARSVSARDQGLEAAVDYEIPQVAVTEAVVNAVAHRNYSSEAAVEVRVFSDRVEVWNPGELPPTLTPERLRKPHSSVPRNPSIAESLFLARYIEKLGTGTLDMISRCRQARLPEPDFEQRAGHFVVTLWRDRFTEAYLAQLVLNERQRQAVLHLRTEGRITNADYQHLTGSNKRTSSRDLDDLVMKSVLQKVGTTGRGTYYVLAGKGDTKGTKGTS